ncbi:MAG TPA: WD40 repeat domain-containing protein, partial [Pirellulaceae bacterium]|nr:WD40 repeat domain-containing protein [Pirellulaceae bacterium]
WRGRAGTGGLMTGACLLVALAVVATPADGLPAAPVTALAFAPDGTSVLAATPHEVAELSWPELKLRRKIVADLNHVHDLAFAPRGKALAIAGGKPGESGRVALVSWPEGMPREPIDAGSDVIYRAAWFPDGSKLALACADKCVYVAAPGGHAELTFQEHSAPVLSAIVIPLANRLLLLSGGRDQTIRVWNADQSDKSLRSFDNHTAAVYDLALRPAADDLPPIVASAGADRTVRFWQPTIGRMLRFSRLASPPLAVCWTADGQQVCAACQDGRVRIVELQTARVVAEHDAIDGWAHSIILAPDGKSILVGGEGGQLKVITQH